MSRFGADRTGNIAVIFALALLPLLQAVGAAVDFTMAMSVRTKMQGRLDSALLAGAVEGKKALDQGLTASQAASAATTVAQNYFKDFTAESGASLNASYRMDGLRLTGTGTASAAVKTNFLSIVGLPTIGISVSAEATSDTQPFMNVYLLVDISASMLLPSTSDGIVRMTKGVGCALACHDSASGSDSYSWALGRGIQLRFQVVNQGLQNLVQYLGSNDSLKSHTKLQLWSFDSSFRQLSPMTSSFSTITSNLPAPELVLNDEAAATPFDSLIGAFIDNVGQGGDGSSLANPKKMVILATDGVNDPTRKWATTSPWLRPQVRVFDTAFCGKFANNNVTVAIINTPYFPMTSDWGYQATLGQPGVQGGSTRVDDIPIALRRCAGRLFVSASSVAEIQTSFTDIFELVSGTRVSK